ncbi:MAG: MFS transporter [Oscillochloris sp.]|nr:MFS transporter [Oscillochloris sp.]
MASPFRSAAFRRLWFSTVVASAGQGIERTLTAWIALELGADAFAIGLTFAVRMVPSLLFGIAAGTLADHVDRPRQLGAVALAAALLMAGFGGWLAISTGAVWHVILFSFFAGCVMVFDTPARQALVLDTVTNDAAQRALALHALAGRFSQALGALVAGVLIAQIGVPGSYLITTLIYVAVALLIGTLQVAQEHRRAGERPQFLPALASSLRMIVDLPVVRTLIIVGLICEIFAFSHLSAVPLFAQNVLAAGPEGLGTLNAALSIGGAIAVALLSLLPERIARQPLLGAVYLLYGLAIVGFGFSRDLVFAALMLLITGFCAAAFDVLQQTLIQLAVPPAQRGRAVGLWVLSIGSAPIGHLEMGGLAALLGVPSALVINGSLTFVAAALLWLRAPAYRWARRGPVPLTAAPLNMRPKPRKKP